MKKIYLDVCCLNKPFDDQLQDRVRLEAEAILLILKRSEKNEWIWIGSSVVDYEIEQTPNAECKRRVRGLASQANQFILVTDKIVERGEQINQLSFRTYDALHIACAEQAQADVFLSTDDKLVRTASRCFDDLNVHIANPLKWLQEEISHD